MLGGLREVRRTSGVVEQILIREAILLGSYEAIAGAFLEDRVQDGGVFSGDQCQGRGEPGQVEAGSFCE